MKYELDLSLLPSAANKRMFWSSHVFLLSFLIVAFKVIFDRCKNDVCTFITASDKGLTQRNALLSPVRFASYQNSASFKPLLTYSIESCDRRDAAILIRDYTTELNYSTLESIRCEPSEQMQINESFIQM